MFQPSEKNIHDHVNRALKKHLDVHEAFVILSGTIAYICLHLHILQNT